MGKASHPKRWRVGVLMALAVVLALTLLPASVLAYANPSAVDGWRQLVPGARHSAPSVLDEETVEPTETEEADDDVEEPEPTETGDPDGEDTPEVTATPTVTDTSDLTTTLHITADVVLRGPITQVPDGAIGAWKIAGVLVTVTSETHLSDLARRAQPGDWAQAWCQRLGDGSLLARSVSVMHANHMVRVVGRIDKIDPWVVAGVAIVVDGDTHIVGKPEVGRVADVHGYTDDDGAFHAKLVVVRGSPNGPKPTKTPRGHGPQVKPSPKPTEVGEQEPDEPDEDDGDGAGRPDKGVKPGDGNGRGRGHGDD